MKYEKLQALPASVFRRITGVKKKTFAAMVDIIQKSDDAQRKGLGGRPPKLTIPDRVLMTLEYLREYRTYLHIGTDYGVSESNAFKIIRRVENALVASKQFALPKRCQALSDNTIQTIVVDCTESPIERPQKQRRYYSGKKKRHTLKTQVVINAKDFSILSATTAQGKTHDFRIYKESRPIVPKGTPLLGDTGYQGIRHIHANSTTPHKRKRGALLTKQEKRDNHALSSRRIVVEHVIGRIKRFRIVADRYRNRRKRFGLRFKLIAGIYNYELVG